MFLLVSVKKCSWDWNEHQQREGKTSWAVWPNLPDTHGKEPGDMSHLRAEGGRTPGGRGLPLNWELLALPWDGQGPWHKLAMGPVTCGCFPCSKALFLAVLARLAQGCKYSLEIRGWLAQKAQSERVEKQTKAISFWCIGNFMRKASKYQSSLIQWRTKRNKEQLLVHKVRCHLTGKGCSGVRISVIR